MRTPVLLCSAEELKLTEDDDVVLVKVSPKKKRKTKSVKKIFGDAKCVSVFPCVLVAPVNEPACLSLPPSLSLRAMAELTPSQIRQWVKVHRDLLVDMWKSKVPSQRHDQFMEGPKSRGQLHTYI